MTKDEYIFIRDYAWKILTISKVDKLPIDWSKICQKFDLENILTDHIDQTEIYSTGLIISKQLLKQIGLKDNDENSKALCVRIMSPLIILDKMNIQSAAELSKITGLPYVIANKRFERLKEKSSTIGMSSMETAVLNTFFSHEG